MEIHYLLLYCDPIKGLKCWLNVVVSLQHYKQLVNTVTHALLNKPNSMVQCLS